MSDSYRKEFFNERLTKGSALVTGLCVLPLYFVFDYMGNSGGGFAAACCAGVLITSARAFWDSRKCVWFWTILVILLLAHIPLVVFVPWTDRSYPGVVLAPYALADFGVVYGCFRLAEKVMGTEGIPSPPE